jgi:hypothetical protein
MVDPHTGEQIALFDPRRDAWRLHFRWDGVRVVGITPTGRTTVMALHMNRPLALVIRSRKRAGCRIFGNQAPFANCRFAAIKLITSSNGF